MCAQLFFNTSLKRLKAFPKKLNFRIDQDDHVRCRQKIMEVLSETPQHVRVLDSTELNQKPFNFEYYELQTVVDKSQDRRADTLIVCCTEAAGLLGRDTEENRSAVPALVYNRMEFTVTT
ncbi:hypothetical protein Y032_0021g258 [Ancylostoma ceylanicum]|uniref:Uncharacterized protein n=1 Tax=Ancylostoma ceylanicum TaxID=53326 RepID=A0A016V1C8_9BILA|nr:hypothetical protein Y032_0021g258 [Ancylostoma ceylanicum]